MIVPCLKQAGWTYVKSFRLSGKAPESIGFGPKVPNAIDFFPRPSPGKWRYLNRRKSPT